MKTMILCAGLGSRLKPWTDHHPKALVPVDGIPMLKRVAGHLIEEGFDEITVNVHHFADQIERFVDNDPLLREKIRISDERGLLLETGGGLLHAAPFLKKDARPVLVHNVDIISNADLKGLYGCHLRSGRHVTLLVSDRPSDRKLAFDGDMSLKGWVNLKSGETRPSGFSVEESLSSLAFSGIYIISPEVFELMTRNGFEGRFPIMDFFLSGVSGLKIGGCVQEGLRLIDIGKPDALRRANLDIRLF